MVRALNKTCICLVVGAVSLAAFAQQNTAPPISTNLQQPEVPITLYNGDSANPYMRFTVGHAHAFSYCTGYLDINATTITFTSLTQASDSFSLPRSSVGRAYVRLTHWVVIPVPGRNYDFLLIRESLVRSGGPGGLLMKNKFNPSPIAEFVNNWGARLDQEKRELKVGEYAPKPIITEPPKPVIGRVNLTTQPGGAQVYVDDIFKGASSERGLLTIEASPGSHMVRVNQPGYKEWSQSVYFANESGTPLSVTLVRNGPEPLTEDEIEQGLAAGITPARMTDKVKELGVNFALNDDIEKKLRDAGADNDLLLAIAKNKR